MGLVPQHREGQRYALASQTDLFVRNEDDAVPLGRDRPGFRPPCPLSSSRARIPRGSRGWGRTSIRLPAVGARSFTIRWVRSTTDGLVNLSVLGGLRWSWMDGEREAD